MTFTVYYIIGLIFTYWGVEVSDIKIFQPYPAWIGLTVMGSAIAVIALFWPLVILAGIFDAINNPSDDEDFY